MAQPTPYAPSHSFLTDQATTPTFPGPQLDVEFANLVITTSQILANLKLIQRDDGKLANSTVTYDALDPSVQSAGLAPLSGWLTSTAYTKPQVVIYNSAIYQCAVSHTSGVFATDLAAGKWTLLSNLSILSGSTSATANTVAAGPTSGAAGTPTFRALVGADLPYPSASSLGGVQSIAAVTSKWVNSISTLGVPSSSQPALSDLSSLAYSASASSAAWTTSGIRVQITGGTLTDTTSSGTVAYATTNLIGGETIAASSAVTFTNYLGTQFKQPIAGANVTIGTAVALAADNLRIGTNPASAFSVLTTGGISTPTGVNATFGGPVIANQGITYTSGITGAAHYGGTSTNSSLTLQATSSGSPSGDVVNIVQGGSTIVQVASGDVVINSNNAGANERGLTVYNANMAAGNQMLIALGQSDSTYNRAQIAFKYAGNASTSNYGWLGLYNQDTVISWWPNGSVGIGTGGNTPTAELQVAGSILSTGTTNGTGIGYGTGVGGTVTQATSRTTGVTINKPTGAITMFSAAGSATAATFTVTNSTVGANDTVVLSVKSATNLYVALVTAVAAGSFNITFYTTGGTSTDAPVINFSVIKGATS